MAQDNKEIEIKLSLDQNSFFNTKEKIKKIARFIKSSPQSDTYYTPPHRNFLEPAHPYEWLSIRKRGDKNYLNYKHFHPENQDKFTHCDELDLEIKDLKQLENLFQVLQFKKLIIVKKERETYQFEDKWEIALDFVENLGYFMEIEALRHQETVESTRAELFQFAQALGLDTTKADEGGYPYLLLKKFNLI